MHNYISKLTQSVMALVRWNWDCLMVAGVMNIMVFILWTYPEYSLYRTMFSSVRCHLTEYTCVNDCQIGTVKRSKHQLTTPVSGTVSSTGSAASSGSGTGSLIVTRDTLNRLDIGTCKYNKVKPLHIYHH